MHREIGFHEIARPIPYAVTEAGAKAVEGMMSTCDCAVCKVSRPGDREGAPLGRSPAVLPGQQEGAQGGDTKTGGTIQQQATFKPRVTHTAAVNTDKPEDTVAVEKPSFKAAARAAQARAEKAIAEEAERCAKARELLHALSVAVYAFSDANGPFVRAYAHLSYSQVRDGKRELEALGAAVRKARNALHEHQAVCRRCSDA